MPTGPRRAASCLGVWDGVAGETVTGETVTGSGGAAAAAGEDWPSGDVGAASKAAPGGVDSASVVSFSFKDEG